MSTYGAAATRERLKGLAQSMTFGAPPPPVLELPAAQVLLCEEPAFASEPAFFWKLAQESPWLVLGALTMSYGATAYTAATLYVALAKDDPDALQRISELLEALRATWMAGPYSAPGYAVTNVAWDAPVRTCAGLIFYSVAVTVSHSV